MYDGIHKQLPEGVGSKLRVFRIGADQEWLAACPAVLLASRWVETVQCTTNLLIKKGKSQNCKEETMTMKFELCNRNDNGKLVFFIC